MALKVGELYASFGIDSSGLDSAISGIEKKCSSIAKGLAVTGAAMTATVTRSVVNAAKSVYDSGTNFHAQMSKVGAIANASAKDLETLTQKALEMGSTTSFTAKEAGDAMEYMAMAGWKTGDMLDGIKPIMDLAAASGESLGTTSDIVTDALTAMGYSAKDAEHFANVMAAASTNANTNVSMMGESFKYVAPLAGTLGYSIDDLAVAMGVMANSGIKSSQAGTSLARILNNMIKPTEDQEEAMKKLGLSLYDSEGKSKSLMQVMQDMRAAAKGNGVDMAAIADSVAELDLRLENGEISEREYMDQMTKLTGVSQDFMASVAELAGTRGLSGMLAIMNASDEDFAKLVDAIENCDGALDEMVAKMLDNAQGDMILFQSAVDGLKISLWDLVEGPFRGIVKSGTKIVQTLQGLDTETQMAAIKTAGLAAAAGPAMTALGGLVGMAGKLIPFLSAMASPLAVVGAGLGLFAVAAVDADNNIGKMLQNLAKNARKQLNKFDSTISKSMRTVSDRMPKLIKSITSSIRTLLPGIMNTGMLVIDGFMQTISSNAGELASIGKEIITQIVSGVSRYAQYLIPDTLSMIGNIAASLIGNLPAFASAAIELGKSILTGLKNVNWREIGLNLLTSVVNAASGIAGELRKLFQDAKTAILNTDWGEVWENIKSAFTEGGNIIKEALLGDSYTEESTWGDVGSKVWTDIKNGFKDVADFGALLVLGDDYDPDASWESVVGAIWKKIKEKGSELAGKGFELLAKLTLGTYTVDTSFGNVITAVWKKAKEKISDLAGKGFELLASLTLGEYTPDTTFGNVVGAVWKAAKGAVSDLANKGFELLAKLTLGTYTPDTTFGQVVAAVWEKAKSGVSSLTGQGFALLAKLTLGSYTPDTTFGQIVAAVWDKAKTGAANLAQKGFELLANLTLGEYTPDTTFGDVVRAVWKTAKEKAIDLISKGHELLANLTLGSYTPSVTFKTVCGKIWQKIKEGVDVFKEKGGQLLAQLVLGEDYQPGDSWQAAGSKIVESVRTGVENAKDTAFSIAEDIIGWITEKLTTLGQEGSNFQWGNLSEILGSMIDSIVNSKVNMQERFGKLAKKLMQGLIDFDWSGVGDLGSTVAGKLIGAIANGFHTLSGAAGGLIDSVGDVLGGTNGRSFIDAATTIAKSIVTSVADALPGLTEDATSLVTSMGSLISKLPWSTMGTDLGDLGTTIIDKATEALNTISTNGGFSGMVGAIGDGMIAAVDGITTAVGTFVGKIAGYLVNPENLAKLAETGAKFAWEVVKGFFTAAYKGVDALGTGLANLMVGIGRGLFGVEVDPIIEQMQQEFASRDITLENGNVTVGQSVIEQLSSLNIDEAVAAWSVIVEEGFAEYFPEFQHLGNEAMAAFAKGVYSDEHNAADLTGDAAEDLAFLFATAYGDNLQNFMNANADRLDYAQYYDLFDNDAFFDFTDVMTRNGIDMGEVFGSSLPEGVRLGMQSGRLVLVDEIGNILDYATDTVENGYDMSRLSDFMANAWGTALETSFGHIEDLNIKWDLADIFSQMGFSASDIMNMDFSSIDFSGLVEQIKAGEITVQEAAMELISGVNETISNNPISVDDAVDGTIDESTKAEITAQAEQTSDAIAGTFDSLPADIQADVAAAMTALITEISNNQEATEIACQAVVTTAETVLSSTEGHTIGINFAKGMAAGIRDGLSGIVAAARRVANAAVNAFRAIWKERSPSRLARNDLAYNFDKGLELGLEDGIRGVATASRRVANTVTDQLYLDDPSRDTVHTARQSAMDTEQAFVRAASSKAVQSGNDSSGQRTVHVMLELNGETIAETFVPIVDETMMAQMAAYSRR